MKYPIFKLIMLMSPLFMLNSGCTRTGNTSGTGTPTGPAKVIDPWPKAVTEIARTPNVVTARRVLNQLNGDLSNANLSLPAFPAEAVTQATALLNPGPDEARDWTATNFTGMDANHLGESLFFDAVADSLGVKQLPVEQQAKAAFDWVCRQVYDRPWVLADRGGQRLMLPPVPPQYVLKRGYGTGIDREYVFLALARQLGLDAVLIGEPGAEKKPRMQPGNRSDNRGPFWAVGIRNGDDVLLFDPWVSAALPAADGKGILTLSAAKANPKPVIDWLTAKKTLQPVTAETITNSVCYFTAPVTVIPPRMKALEEKLSAESGVKLAVIPADLVARSAKLPGGAPKWYAPPVEVDPYAVPHVLGSFLPKADGGYDTKPPSPEQLAFLLLQMEFVNPYLFAMPAELTGDTARREFFIRCVGMYKTMLADSDIRDKIQRGQFNEAIKQLQDLDRTFATQRDRQSDPQVIKGIAEWYTAANRAYENLSLARLPENAGSLTEADSKVDELWKSNPAGAAAVQLTVVPVGATEVAYWQALAKHEQAVRSQTRFQRATAANLDTARAKAAGDWAVAKDEWSRFLEQAPRFEKAFPGRAAHTRTLSQRAAAKMTNPDGN